MPTVLKLHEDPSYKELLGSSIPRKLLILGSSISASKYVSRNPARYFYSESHNHYSILVDVTVPASGCDPLADIKLNEPISFLFRINEAGGLQIIDVRSDRSDFPRELPHTNPVYSNHPVSLCLSRDGLSTLFHNHGILGVLKTTSRWLCRARSNQLEHDGWEPVPVSKSAGIEMDVSAFQRYAFNVPRKKKKCCSSYAQLAISQEDSDKFSPVIARTTFASIKESEVWQYRAIDNHISSNSWGFILDKIPLYFCWGDKEKAIEKRHLPTVNSVLSLSQFSEDVGCNNEIKYLLISLAPQLVGKENHRPYFIVIIGVWRPRRLIKDIPGIAEDDAAKLELFAFTSYMENKEKNNPRYAPFIPMEIEPELNPNLLYGMTGYQKKLSAAAVIGCGALGSKVIDHLTREGIKYLSIIDHDRLLAHNIARHTLDSEAIWRKKANSAKERCIKLGMTEYQVRARNWDILSVHENSLADEIGIKAKLVIDTTASPVVLEHLSHPSFDKPIVNCSMALGGQLGLILIEGNNRNPRVDDIKATLLLEALGDDESAKKISDWMHDDEDEHEVRTGMTCASATMKMPDHRVSLHAANFMSRISLLLRDEGDFYGYYGITTLDQEGSIRSTKWERVPEFVIWRVEVEEDDDRSWFVRIHPNVTTRIETHLEEALPNEVGGYLYGTFSIDRRSIIIVEAIPVISKNAEDSSPTHLVIPPAGKTHRERWLLNRSNGKLQLVGAWHTHPSGAAKLSPTDIRQKIEDACVEFNPCPFVHYIKTKDNFCVDISYPKSWVPQDTFT